MAMTREKAYEMIKELLEIEEAADSFNLTRKERREFQQIVEDVFTAQEKPAEKLCVQTPEGELRAYVEGDTEYPSISVKLGPAGIDEEICVSVVEFSPEEGIRSFTYGNAMDDECTFVENIKNIKGFVDNVYDSEMEGR